MSRMLMVLSYGKGRVFHTTLGHDVSALSSVDFVATFQRGTEWAATGAVTQKIPADFPTADAVSVRADLAAMDQHASHHRRRRGKPPTRPPQASPAAVPPPPTATPQSYPPEQVRAGQPIFAAQCGFCHGRDAMGGESGPDLTRSALVATDVRGDKIGPVVRNGRVDKGMPAFNLNDADLAADRRVHSRPEDEGGVADRRPPGRRCRGSADRQRRGGQAVFRRRLREVPFADRRSRGPRQAAAGARAAAADAVSDAGRRTRRRRAKVTVTLPSGEIVAGTLAYRDEFTIALTDRVRRVPRRGRRTR